MGVVTFLLDRLHGAIAFRDLVSMDRILDTLAVAGRLDSQEALRREIELAEQRLLEERKGASKL